MNADTADTRRVHARSGDCEVVRYEAAGEWYIERAEGRDRCATAASAAWAAVNLSEVEIVLGLPGGAVFDRCVTVLLGGER